MISEGGVKLIGIALAHSINLPHIPASGLSAYGGATDDPLGLSFRILKMAFKCLRRS